MNTKQKLLSAAMLASAALFICGCAGKEEGGETSTDEPATTQSADGEGG